MSNIGMLKVGFKNFLSQKDKLHVAYTAVLSVCVRSIRIMSQQNDCHDI